MRCVAVLVDLTEEEIEQFHGSYFVCADEICVQIKLFAEWFRCDTRRGLAFWELNVRLELRFLSGLGRLVAFRYPYSLTEAVHDALLCNSTLC